MQNCFRLTTVCNLLGVEKKIVRKWVNCLKPFSLRDKQERIAIEFSSIDLLFLYVIRELNLTCGVSIEKISEFSESLFVYLQKPIVNTSSNVTYLSQAEGKWIISDNLIPNTYSFCLAVGNARENVLDALGIGNSPQQRKFNFGLITAKG